MSENGVTGWDVPDRLFAGKGRRQDDPPYGGSRADL
jgi:hypothetical protein